MDNIPLETIFSACSILAMLGWAGLALLPRVAMVRDVIAPIVIPCIIAVVYIALMATYTGTAPAEGGFDSLAGVKALFSVDGALLAGWVHYLAFDLFVGAWELRDGQREGIHHLLLLPCLLATLMIGPAGLLLYILLRQGNRWLRARAATTATAS